MRPQSNTNGGFALPDDDEDGPGVGHVVDPDQSDPDDEEDEVHGEDQDQPDE